ncbi:MAG: acyloxyacyl hydrolase [Gemmatimonadaceae bacterium]
MRLLALLLYPLLSSVLLALRPDAAAAQSRPDIVGAWVAVARNSPFLTRLGVEHRDFYALALRAGWTLGSFPGVTLSYVGDVLPIVVTTNNVNGFDLRSCGGPFGDCYYTQLRTGTVFGTGLSPIGLAATLGPFRSLSLQLHANAGALWFTRAVPDPQAVGFNFTASGGGAIQIPLRTGYAALVGYMLHHTSNGGLGQVNPGLDSHMLYVGMTRKPRMGREVSHVGGER